MYVDSLRFAIVGRAVEDLKVLLENKTDSMVIMCKEINIKELKNFFDSEYCSYLLLGSQLNGSAIYNRLVKEYGKSTRTIRTQKQTSKTIKR